MKVDVVKEDEVVKIETLVAYVESETTAGVYYKVIRTNEGFTCTCPTSKYRNRYCKHIEAVQFRE